MKRLKSLCAIVAAALFCLAMPANAQQEEEVSVSYPQIFVGAQGGGQITLTDYDNWKLLTPTASLSVGSFFTPIIGARLHVNGMWNKGGFMNSVDNFRNKLDIIGNFNCEEVVQLAKEAKINSCFIALDKIFMQHNSTNIYLAYIVPESVK